MYQLEEAADGEWLLCLVVCRAPAGVVVWELKGSLRSMIPLKAREIWTDEVNRRNHEESW